MSNSNNSVLPKDQDILLQKWNAAKESLDETKKQELVLRKQVAEEIFPDARVGTNKLTIAGSWVAKFVKKINKRINQKIMQQILPQLSDDTIKRCLKVTYSIDYKAMEQLSEKDKMLLQSAITESVGAPALTIVQEKR